MRMSIIMARVELAIKLLDKPASPLAELVSSDLSTKYYKREFDQRQMTRSRRFSNIFPRIVSPYQTFEPRVEAALSLEIHHLMPRTPCHENFLRVMPLRSETSNGGRLRDRYNSMR